MAVTVKGFQGTVSDADMATQSYNSPGSVATPSDLVITAVSGARQVSVSAGAALAHFVKYISDAAQILTLTPPSSGGKWYAVAIDREWSPTNTATLVAVDTGVTTDGSVQASIAACLTQGGSNPTALTWQKQNPGTAGSTAAYGHHQVLGFVHVRAADTTLQILGTRLIGGGAGMPFAENLHALAWHAQTAGGGRANKLAVGPHALGGQQVQSIEAIGNGFGSFILQGRVFAGNDVTMAGLGAALAALLTAYSGVGRLYGEALNGGKAGLCLLDPNTVAGYPSDWAWNGTSWYLISAEILPAKGINGGIGLPGTVTQFSADNAGYSCRATKDGRHVDLRWHVNVGANGLALGGLFGSLPDGFRPQDSLAIQWMGWDADSNGWGGPPVNVQIGSDGTLKYQGVSGKGAPAAYPANKSIFGSIGFRAA